MDDVHSGGHMDGDGGVVGRHVEVEMATRQNIRRCLLAVEGKKIDVEEQTQLFLSGGDFLLVVG